MQEHEKEKGMGSGRCLEPRASSGSVPARAPDVLTLAAPTLLLFPIVLLLFLLVLLLLLLLLLPLLLVFLVLLMVGPAVRGVIFCDLAVPCVLATVEKSGICGR